jgi:putative hydrolase of the HAD superfamily
MIKGVIFDFDNTLYNYEACNEYALGKLFEKIASKTNHKKISKVKETYDSIQYTIKKSNNSATKFNKSIYIKQLLEELSIPIQFFNLYYSIYETAFYEKFQLFNYVKEVLLFLHNKNIKIGILSNNIFSQQIKKLERANIIEYIDIILTSDEIGEEKPNNKMFDEIQRKMGIPFENMAYVGDNMYDDILPSLKNKMLTFWFNPFMHNLHVEKDYVFCISHYRKLFEFFERYFDIVQEYVFLSKIFGQSLLNVQGQGGNISIKYGSMMFIKSSGFILGNTNEMEGYCIVNNDQCLKQLTSNTQGKVDDTKILGYKTPSMETYFHSFMKVYTVHLHFTLSNIYFCGLLLVELPDFKQNYKVVEYYNPGMELATQLLREYTKECDIYFLKNHGLIITGNTLQEIMDKYKYIYMYFVERIHKTHNVKIPNYEMMEQNISTYLYCILGKCKIVHKLDFSVDELKNMVYCFPDLAVFLQNIKYLEDENTVWNELFVPDIVVYDSIVFGITDNITKMYSLIEILDSYKIIQKYGGKLKSIENIDHLQNMKEEQNRKKSV